MGHPLVEGLSDDCREMLKTSVLTSLCLPKDERHEIQTDLVTMIGQVIDEVLQKLKGTAEQVAAELSEAEQAHKVLTDAAESADLALAGSTEVAAAKQAAFAA